MTSKIQDFLKTIQKIVPINLLYQLQDIHSQFIYSWITQSRSQAVAPTQKSAMVFSPHQDDETFGCGGMIALKREQGIPVVVVFLTDGQGGGDGNYEEKQHIIETRKKEALAALKILGVESSEVYFFNKQDGKLPDLDIESRKHIVVQITNLLNKYQPGEVYVPHQKDCHRDHEATFSLVKAAINETQINIDFFQYPIWMFWRAPLFIMLKLSDIAAANPMSITSVREKKRNAIASYISQIEHLPSGFVKRFLVSDEIFFKS